MASLNRDDNTIHNRTAGIKYNCLLAFPGLPYQNELRCAEAFRHVWMSDVYINSPTDKETRLKFTLPPPVTFQDTQALLGDTTAMSDPSDTKRASIPEWQKKPTESSPEQPPSPTAQDDKSQSSPTLLEQATRFLEDESIRDASTDRKIAFLESKGLQNEDIQKLLGISRNTEATANGDDTSSDTAKPSDSETETETVQSSQTQSTSSSPPSPAPASPSTPARTDAPPIITYPEFLMKSQKPPPLITFRGVLYTLYGAAGLATGIYGLSQYVVTPMLETLSTARHDLAETAHQNLQTLNEKLEKNVSAIPPLPARKGKSNTQKEDEDEEGSSDSDETDSAASDPTELFHRDIATQTTSDLASSSTTTTITSDQKATEDPHKTVTSHHKRLETISSHLSEFLSMENDASKNTTAGSNFHGRLSELQTYLTSLTYSSPSYLNSSLYGVYGGDVGMGSATGGKAGEGEKATGIAKAEEDAISSFKSEIRGVKGALLSARNFPAGGGRASSAMAR